MIRLIPAILVAGSVFAQVRILSPAGATAAEQLAAREVRRYFYLRTGRLLPVANAERYPGGEAIVVARADRPLARAANARPGSGEYRLKTVKPALYLLGGDDTGTLYAAYSFAAKLGVRFYLHGDVVPDERIAAALPALEETGKPLFSIRGIQPFHDFPEGPDWWNREDYLAYVAQLPKLRMNFLGLHTYPESDHGPEPAVWIGQPGDFGSGGKVAFAYPASWANTVRKDMWGYAATSTSEFSGGAAQLFEDERYGPEVMRGLMPVPLTPAESVELFHRAGEMLRDAFTLARALGVKTCIGTETPLTVPAALQDRLKTQGRQIVARDLYRGIFARIAATCPIDYYWLWTPEDWTWGGNKPEAVEATAADIRAALGALDDLLKPFTLATSGWVLGPQQDRSGLDRILPRDVPMSCINRKVGHAPVEPAFANIQGRPKWAIPWLENDPNLAAQQPWVGRMRYDAADALRLGCTGLVGIHWRTKILAANIAALADAAWDQKWVPASFDTRPVPPGQKLTDPAAEGNGHEHPLRGRSMPVEEFYADFARANFGAGVAAQAGAILARTDGAGLPEPTKWDKGPGGIIAAETPWEQIRDRYRFVDEFAALRAQVRGAGNLERFDYWLGTFRCMAEMARMGALRGVFEKQMTAIKDEKSAASRQALAREALANRVELARSWERMMSALVAVAGTPGELGTIANLEQHNRRLLHFLDAHDAELAAALGSALADSAQPGGAYRGEARVFVPSVRTLAAYGERLSLKIIAPAPEPVRGVRVYWRGLGAGALLPVAALHVGRAVYRAELPALAGDIEYYVEAETAKGGKLVWPATAPKLNQTVVAWAKQ